MGAEEEEGGAPDEESAQTETRDSRRKVEQKLHSKFADTSEALR